MRTPSVFLAALLLAAPLAAQTYSRAPQPLAPDALPANARAAVADDGSWDDRFGHPSVTYTAYTMALAPDGDLYVGGTFTSIGGVKANNVARWDGRRWHALGDGIENGNGYVYALAFGPDGAVYVGGYFANAGGTRANSIARWDPATETWSAVGQGLGNGAYKAYVYALAFQGTTLYAGGDFTSSGTTPLKKFARWNGTEWEDLGAGLGRQSYDGTFSPEGPSVVRALAVRDAEVFVGGSFDAVAEGRANSLARFDTQTGTFRSIGGGVGNGTGYESAGLVNTLAVEAARVCVGGKFDRVGLLAATNAPANNVACWDGAAWNTLGEGLQGTYGATVSGLTFAGDALVATGAFDTAGGQQARRLARWDGAGWSEVGGGLGSDGSALVFDGQGGFFVTGGFDTVGDDFGALRIAQWAETEWRALGQGLSYNSIVATENAIVVSGGRVYVGGSQTHSGGVPTANISAWDGTRWHALGAGTDNTVRALAAGPDGSIYVGGDFTQAGGQAASRVARWNPVAQTWSPLGSGLSGSVRVLTVGPDGALYAGGEFRSAGGVAANYVARWDGQQWHALGGGVNSYVYALAVTAEGKVYVGGDFSKADGNETSGIAVWDGVNWSALGAGLKRDLSGYLATGKVYDIEVIRDEVYVAGDFDIAGGGTATGISRWSLAGGWSALGAGIGGGDETGYALATDGRALYVGGNFASAGGQAAGSIARWDLATQTWNALGNGVGAADTYYQQVNALARDGGDLYATGRFQMVDGLPAASFAVWHGQAAVAEAHINVDPPVVNFGDQTTGTTVDLMISVGNDAAATDPLVGTVSLPVGTPFSIVEGAGAFTVQPGGVHEVIVRFAPQAEGEATATVSIEHNAVNVGTPVEVTLRGTGVSRGGPIVLRGFDPNGVQATPGAQNGGFVFGTNGYGDRAKGVAFTVPVGKNAQAALVTAIDVWFSYADPLPGEATYTLALYDGTAQTGPQGAPRYSKVYRVADIRADDDVQTRSEATVHALDTPLAVQPGASFFAVVDFSAYASRTNLLAIAAGAEVPQRVPEVWDQDANGTWGNVSDLWKGGEAGWPLWIEAVLGTATPNETVETPHVLALEEAVPNPFGSVTTIRYTLEKSGPVVLDVFDVTGRRVATLVEGVQAAGAYAEALEAHALASGTYVVRLQSGGQTRTRAVVLLR